MSEENDSAAVLDGWNVPKPGKYFVFQWHHKRDNTFYNQVKLWMDDPVFYSGKNWDDIWNNIYTAREKYTPLHQCTTSYETGTDMFLMLERRLLTDCIGVKVLDTNGNIGWWFCNRFMHNLDEEPWRLVEVSW